MIPTKYAVMWEENGSETVVHGTFDSHDEAHIYMNEWAHEVFTFDDDDDGIYTSEDVITIEPDNRFSIVNYVEKKS